MSQEVRNKVQECLSPQGSVSVENMGEPWKAKICLHLRQVGTPLPPTPQPKHLQRPKRTLSHLHGALSTWVSHQACVVPIHALRLLHHAGEAAGTR